MPFMDLANDSSRQLIDTVLPTARREYIAAWEFLATSTHPLARRRAARERASNGAEQHELAAGVLHERAESEAGETKEELRYLAGELARLATGLRRIATLSPHAVAGAADARPDAVGCGRKYRDPSRSQAAPSASRAAPLKPKRRSDERSNRRS
jgi:hypothetical protein